MTFWTTVGAVLVAQLIWFGVRVVFGLVFEVGS